MSGWWLVAGGVGRVGRARGIIGEFEPNGVENWESMEGEVGDLGGGRCVEIVGDAGSRRLGRSCVEIVVRRGIWWDERGRAGDWLG